MAKQLRDYQRDALQAVRDSVRQGVKRVVLQAPTGSGKTLVACDLVNGALSKGNRMTFVVSSLSLIDQAVTMFWDEGIRDVGVIQANHVLSDWSRPIQIASIQTINSRKIYPECQAVVIDECHQLHKAHIQWMQHPDWKDVPFVGLSATPWTSGLGKYFETLLVMSTTRELIDRGYLSKFKVYAADHPDLSQVKVVAGDYHEKQLSGVMQSGGLVANVIETWRTMWGKDKTLVFGVDCAHAEALRDRFLEAGISCAYQDAQTPSAERAAIKRGFHDGTYRVVCNVGTLTTGVDWDVRCLVLARPTKSEMLFVQICGRALRTADGKDHALILDHTDTTSRLGMVTDIHHEHLSGGKFDQSAKVIRKPALPKPCPKCDFLIPPRVLKCPECGYERKIESHVHEREGVLVEFTGSSRARKKTSPKLFPYTPEEKARFYQQLKGYALERGYKPGWAFMKFIDKFAHKPEWAWQALPPMAPGPEVRNWIKAALIAWAQSRNRPHTNEPA
jgi:superfamily II DNA or RNA helicase